MKYFNFHFFAHKRIKDDNLMDFLKEIIKIALILIFLYLYIMEIYEYKYEKYKNKYLDLKREKEVEKYAIVYLCILNDDYVIGACINAYVNKQFIKKIGKNIELVIMCDDIIYNKYHKLLSIYFDKVTKIELLEFTYAEKFKYPTEKYSSWFFVSLNKWQCLKFIEYKKILFLDIDILPINKSFYDIFSFNTPAFNIQKFMNDNGEIRLDYDKYNDCVDNVKIKNNAKGISYDKYLENIIEHESMNGGFCLLEPSIDLYNKYIDFIKKTYKDGIYSLLRTGPDETSIFYFYKQQGMNMYSICNRYLVVPWDNKSEIKGAYGINYLSFIKPWLKPIVLLWDEEKIWHDIFISMPQSQELIELYNEKIDKYIKKFYSLPKEKQDKWFNTTRLKNINNKNINNITLSSRDNFKLLNKKTTVRSYGMLNLKKIVKEILL